VVEYMDQKMRTQGPSALAEGVGLAKRMAVGSFSPHRSQGRTFDNPPAPLQRSQISKLCRKCN
jgi:hypothetical protein